MFKYFIPINMGRLTAAFASGVLWAMRNSSSESVRIRLRGASFVVAFDGVGNPSTAQYGVYRFSGANFAGGTSITPVGVSSQQPPSKLQDARQNAAAALTQVGVVIEPFPLIATLNQRDPGATTAERHTWRREDDCIQLNPGEGLCIKIDVASVIGDSIAGYFSYDEHLNAG